MCADTAVACPGEAPAPALVYYSHQNPFACLALGNLSTATWSLDASNRVQVSYTGGSECPFNTSTPRYSFALSFVCNCSSPRPGELLSMSPPSAPVNVYVCHYAAELHTYAACPTPCPVPGAGPWYTSLGWLSSFVLVGCLLVSACSWAAWRLYQARMVVNDAVPYARVELTDLKTEAVREIEADIDTDAAAVTLI